MLKFHTKKDLKTSLKNRDILINDQQNLISNLKSVINSLEEDLKAVKEEAYKTAKKPTTRKKAK